MIRYGILSGIFRSRDAPKDRTIGSNYSFFMADYKWKRVNERSAMQMTAVYSRKNFVRSGSKFAITFLYV